MKLDILYQRLKSLTVYRFLLKEPILDAAVALIDELERIDKKALPSWAELVSLLQEAGAESIGMWLWDKLRYTENPWGRLVEAGGSAPALEAAALKTDFSRKNLPPCPAFLFGTDWMGRDMLRRTLAGLSLSVRVGGLTAAVSAAAALVLGGAAAAFGGWVDALISWITDLVMGIPHILLIILISIACGRGLWGVTIGVALSHWTSLARLIRGEVLQLKGAPYLQLARRLGVSRRRLVKNHLLPHLMPQFLTGLILQFPHAILHEASVTFLGFGLSPEQPAIGIILAESMGYLTTGRWWLALFPGLSLVGAVMLFALAGERLRLLLSPATAQD